MGGNRFRLPAEEFPRPRRASSWLITHSPTCSTLDADRTVPLPSGHQGLPHTGCDVDHIVRHFDWIPNSNPADRNEDPRSCRLAPCPVFKYEAISHTHTHTQRAVPDSPMPRTPPVHREDSLPRVRCWVNQIHGSATRAHSCLEWSRQSMEPQKMKAGRWERPAFSNSSAWESGRSLGCVGRGFNERLGNRWRTWDTATS
jgi:hypothetical protein